MRCRGLLLSLLLLAVSSCAHAPRVPRLPSDISVSKVPGYAPPEAGGFDWSGEARSSEAAPQGLRIRWLGASGFELSDDATTLLIDPFVSRPSMLKVLLLNTLEIDTDAVNFYALSNVDLSRVRAILTSHAHHDHVMDVPYILAKYPAAATRPLVVGTDDIPRLLATYDGREEKVPWLRGVDPLSKSPVQVIDSATLKSPAALASAVPWSQRFGDFKVTAFVSEHGYYDDYPMIGLDGPVSGRAPLNALDYGANHHATIAYLIEHRGLRFFFTDSATSKIPDLVMARIGKVDVLFKGIASRMHEGKIFDTIAKLRPRTFVPTHFDNFFKSFHDLKELNYRIPIPVDQVKYEAFLEQFRHFKDEGPQLVASNVKLRLMRPLFYYSLEHIR